MAETTEEIAAPEYDRSKIRPGVLWNDPMEGVKFFPPVLNKARCGTCYTEIECVDPEGTERMFSGHSCVSCSEPPSWHESTSEVLRSLFKWTGIVLIVAVVLGTLTLQLPWMK